MNNIAPPIESTKTPHFNQRILRRPAVEYITGLPRSSIYAEMKKGAFPQPVKLSARAVGWLLDDIENWLQRQIDNRPSHGQKFDSNSA